MGLVDKIKAAAAKSGGNKKKIFYVADGQKKMIRFLEELDQEEGTGHDIKFHSNFTAGIKAPCQETFGRTCPLCNEDEIRDAFWYCFSVWDFDAKEVKLLAYPANSTTPITQLMAMNENYGTIMDRNYVLSCTGKAKDRTFAVIPQDKSAFKNTKAAPLSKSAIYKIIDKAFPLDDSVEALANEDDEYSSLNAKELFELCKDKDIEVLPRQTKEYYIERLNDSKEDDSWGDDSEDEYAGKSPKELFKLCKDKGLDVEQRKPEKYYITKLKELETKTDEWADEEDTSDDDWG